MDAASAFTVLARIAPFVSDAKTYGTLMLTDKALSREVTVYKPRIIDAEMVSLMNSAFTELTRRGRWQDTLRLFRSSKETLLTELKRRPMQAFSKIWIHMIQQHAMFQNDQHFTNMLTPFFKMGPYSKASKDEANWNILRAFLLRSRYLFSDAKVFRCQYFMLKFVDTCITDTEAHIELAPKYTNVFRESKGFKLLRIIAEENEDMYNFLRYPIPHPSFIGEMNFAIHMTVRLETWITRVDDFLKHNETYKGRRVYRGKKGGKYYLTQWGTKKYVTHLL